MFLLPQIDDCVLEVADNSKLKGDYKWAQIKAIFMRSKNWFNEFMPKWWNYFIFRTALNNGIVEGYLIDPSKPWCNPYAISEPSFTKKVGI